MFGYSHSKKHETWYENGQVYTRANLKNGKLDGEAKEWYANGRIWTRSFYLDGLSNGKRIHWFPDGRIWSIIFFLNGKREGEQKIWYGQTDPISHSYLFPIRNQLCDFSTSNKLAFLKIKKLLIIACHKRYFPILDSYFISDLTSGLNF